ncbi:MAG: tryptophan--tRNA ligase [Proteobacteria bacterium]|nr:tryptophan--tRNA ligase [Pseudomonadota bacterium]
MTTKKERVFSGIQPSGDIHIGNYMGAIKKWVELTDTHECIYCIVDDHAITVDYDPALLPQRTFDGALAVMACGLDPEKCALFVQSHVPEHTELTWLFNTVTPLGSLFRMTQFKDKARNALQRALNTRQGGARKTALFQLKNIGLKMRDLMGDLHADVDELNPTSPYKGEQEIALTELVARLNDRMGAVMQHLQVGLGVAEASVGLFDYPVLQAADILLYKAPWVPVGEDQEQHLELCREVAERFNRKFGDIFPAVQRIRGETAKIIGLDGKQKMSKSLNNTIGILDSYEEIERRLKPAYTDPRRLRRDDPGHPEDCNIFALHKLFSSPEACAEIAEGCSQGTLGCLECKQRLAHSIDAHLAPIRDRAETLRANPSRVIAGIEHGREQASRIAVETMREVRDAMGIGKNALAKF